MKRFFITLSIIIVAMLFPCFSILAQPARVPHENPAMVKDSPDLLSLLRFYASVFDFAVTSQYKDAQAMLNELEHATIPEDLRYLIDRFSTLSSPLFTTLDELKPLLAEVESLLDNYQLNEAKKKLDEAGAAISEAQLRLDDIEATTGILSDRLGVFLPAAGSQVRQVHSRLTDTLYRLRQAIDEFSRLQQTLSQRYQTQMQVGLIPTELSLKVSVFSIFVGGSFTVSGELTSGGTLLGSRSIAIDLDGESKVVTTDSNGAYSTRVTVPYKYKPTMTLNAAYTPSDKDIGVYLACESQPVPVNTMFYPTRLEASAPATGHPGLPITVTGQVSSTGDAVEQTVKVLFDDIQLAEEVTQGRFNIQISPPPQISPGKHSLTVIVPPQGYYSGTSKSLAVDISKIPIALEIQKPVFVIIPKSIGVSGQVHSGDNVLANALVKLKFRDSAATVSTDADGIFGATLDTRFDLSLAGPQELEITAEPVEPWYASLQVEQQIITINPANLGLMLAIFVSSGLVVFKRVRSRPPGRREMTVGSEEKVEGPLIVAQTPGPAYEFKGTKGRALAAYLDGMKAVEKVTRITMEAHVTLREFLNTAILKIPRAASPFSELTLIAERALYSAYEFGEATAARAEHLADIVKGELGDGTA